MMSVPAALRSQNLFVHSIWNLLKFRSRWGFRPHPAAFRGKNESPYTKGFTLGFQWLYGGGYRNPRQSLYIAPVEPEHDAYPLNETKFRLADIKPEGVWKRARNRWNDACTHGSSRPGRFGNIVAAEKPSELL